MAAAAIRLSRSCVRKSEIVSCLAGQISGINPPSPCPPKGTLRDRHGTLARVAMDAVASGGFFPPDENAAAYGEVVWSWRRDPGVKLSGRSRMATVAKQAAHRGEHV